MSKHKAIITGLLTVALGTVPEELAELLEKSDETDIDEKEFLKTFREKDKERVSNLKKTAHDDGYKKAEKKVKTEVETTLKEKFEIDSDKQGEDLFDEIIENVSKKDTGKKGQLTDDDVKKHSLYLQLEKQLKEKETSVKAEYEQKIEALQKQYSREKVVGTVSNKVLEIFESLNPVLSSDAAKAANQKKAFAERFNGYDWEEADGEFYPVKDGKRMEDDHGHAITLSGLVKSTAETLYDFKAASDRTSPGEKDKGKDDKSKTTYTGKLPKTQAEYEAMLNDRTLPLADRKAINDHWVTVSAGGE